MGEAIKHIECPKCREIGGDTAGDNLAVYADGSVYCWCCHYKTLSDEYKSHFEMEVEFNSMAKESITPQRAKQLQQAYGYKGNNFRGISDETLKYYMVLSQKDTTSGKVTHRYYPATEYVEEEGRSRLKGYKVRIVETKEFASEGRFGNCSDFFGEFRASVPSKIILIVGGECDAMAAHQMLSAYRKRKGNDGYSPITVLSPMTGENCRSVVQRKYEYLNQADKIIIGFDNDKAGWEATEQLVDVLPKGKMHVAKWSMKDPNEMLETGKEKQFISDYFNAKPYVPSGIVGSSNLMEAIRESVMLDKISLPPFMSNLQKMMRGGIPLGYIVNIGAETGQGKTTVINEMIYHWIFNSPYLLGIVSLELDKGQYGKALLSRHISCKIDLIGDKHEALAFVDSYEVQEKALSLFTTKEGQDRFLLIDDRDGSVQHLQDKVEEMVIKCGVKVIVLDPIQDILDSLGNDQQNEFMTWQKGMVKSHKVSFININHLRKLPPVVNNKGKADEEKKLREPTEDDFHGSSSIAKSAGCNILIWRDKDATDERIKNTTNVKVPKIRWTGLTGYSTSWYYDNETHTMHDKKEFFAKEKF